jgi:hypothetical protein
MCDRVHDSFSEEQLFRVISLLLHGAEDILFDLSKNLITRAVKDRLTPAYLFEQQVLARMNCNIFHGAREFSRFHPLI